MKNRVIYGGFTVMLAAMTFVGCINDRIDEPLQDIDSDPLFTLQLCAGEQTRATVIELNDREKTVENVELFFYALDATDDTPASFVCHAGKPDENGKLAVRMRKDVVASVFPADKDNKCKVYTVVNSAEAAQIVDKVNSTEETAPKISELRELKVATTEFSTSETFKKFAMFTTNENGDEIANDPNANNELHVKVLAAKIDLFINVADNVTGADGVTYEPYYNIVNGKKQSTANAWLVNGTQAVRLGGWNDSSFLAADDYYDLRSTGIPHNFAEVLDLDKNSLYPYVTENAFYSYPNVWSLTMQEQHRTMMILQVDWEKQDGEEGDNLVPSYYMVPVNMTGEKPNTLESGCYYRINVNINTLGSPNMDTPVELEELSCEILPWGDTGLSAEAREPRFLEVTQSVFNSEDGKNYAAIMQNSTRTTIPYYSSHTVKVASVKITYMDYNPPTIWETQNGWKNPDNYEPQEISVRRYKTAGKVDTRVSQDAKIDEATFSVNALSELDDDTVSGVYIDTKNHNIIFQHTLTSIEIQGNYYKPIGDLRTYSPYWITVELCHEDDPSVTETFNVIQYPGIYITYERTLGNLGHQTQISGMSSYIDRGGVYVNGGASERPGSSLGVNHTAHNTMQCGGISGLRTGNSYRQSSYSNDPFMYVIHITQLSEQDVFAGHRLHIGDPRVNYVNNYLTNGDEHNHYHSVSQGCPETDLLNNDSYMANGVWSNKGAYDDNDYRKEPVNTYALYDDGGTGMRQIQYYYPTNEGQMEDDAYRVAPVIRLNSAYGTLRSLKDNQTRMNARVRCAGYQEMGYPAGRWRLPTLGEMQIYSYLSSETVGIIPDVFGIDICHWTAQGGYKVRDSGEITPENSTSQRYVRCVYDDWYWIKKDSKGNFVPDNLADPEYKIRYNHLATAPWAPNGDLREIFFWGDKPKDNPQTTQMKLLRAMQIDEQGK